MPLCLLWKEFPAEGLNPLIKPSLTGSGFFPRFYPGTMPPDGDIAPRLTLNAPSGDIFPPISLRPSSLTNTLDCDILLQINAAVV